MDRRKVKRAVSSVYTEENLIIKFIELGKFA